MRELQDHHVSRDIPESFMDLLHSLDKDLQPRWNAVKLRWEIFRSDKYIMTVQTVDGGYAPLDNRVIQKLFVIDTHRYSNEFGLVRHLRLEDEHLMKMKRKEQDEFVRACYRDMAPFLRGRHSVNANIKKENSK